MPEIAKGPSTVLQPEDGDAYWQPLPSTGYVINKLTPYCTPYDGFAAGLQVLEPDGTSAATRMNAATRCCSAMPARAGPKSDGQRHEVRAETIILVGRGVWHTVHNTGPGQMRLLWLMMPAGLEDWFRAIGRPRVAGEAMPAPFERPSDIGDIMRQQRFVAVET